MRRHQTCLCASLIALTTANLGGFTAYAQDVQQPHRPIRHVRVVQNAPAGYRGLTINRAPSVPGSDEADDIYRDGPTRYNDIRDFSPAPYATSGVEYPYGLDGIGGYGSDLGFGAGQDSALYDRGAGGW